MAGLLAGVIESFLFVTPLERIKILSQTILNKRNTIYTITKENGLQYIWRGNLSTAIKQGMNMMVRFGLFDSINNEVSNRFYMETATSSFISGGISGILSAIVSNPIDVIKTRIQASPVKKGIYQTFLEIYINHGVSGLYKGLAIRCPRIFISQAITFSIYNSYKKYII